MVVKEVKSIREEIASETVKMTAAQRRDFFAKEACEMQAAIDKLRKQLPQGVINYV